MLAAEHQPDLFANVALPKHELLEIRRSTISKHHEKTGYNYPTIRLPHTFEALSGLFTRIFQTVHHGVLAFLVVVSPAEVSRKARQLKNDVISAKPPSLHGEGRRFESGRAIVSFFNRTHLRLLLRLYRLQELWRKRSTMIKSCTTLRKSCTTQT